MQNSQGGRKHRFNWMYGRPFLLFNFLNVPFDYYLADYLYNFTVERYKFEIITTTQKLSLQLHFYIAFFDLDVLSPIEPSEFFQSFSQ